MLRKSFVALAIFAGTAALAAPAVAQRHGGHGDRHGRSHSGAGVHIGTYGYGYSSRRYYPRNDPYYYYADYAPGYYGQGGYDSYYPGSHYGRAAYDRGYYRDRYRGERRHRRHHRRHH